MVCERCASIALARQLGRRLAVRMTSHWLCVPSTPQKQRLQRKPRVFRSSAVADYSFLDNVHQGVFYKVWALPACVLGGVVSTRHCKQH